MICFRDMTFCPANDCLNMDTCPRALTEEVLQAADEWWGGLTGEAPIATWLEPPSDCYEPTGEVYS